MLKTTLKRLNSIKNFGGWVGRPRCTSVINQTKAHKKPADTASERKSETTKLLKLNVYCRQRNLHENVHDSFYDCASFNVDEAHQVLLVNLFFS